MSLSFFLMLNAYSQEPTQTEAQRMFEQILDANYDEYEAYGGSFRVKWRRKVQKGCRYPFPFFKK